ncbi:PxKF domain-containing protein [Variovorax sp. KK3]|uniref:PxKF domain-containing protein n=1 Tax=Variovorax sp. KK3 TaxID=1855728 RepID=UPI00097C5219|nr:PxKF domain-containing protein [Variovorax sp. KK3]
MAILARVLCKAIGVHARTAVDWARGLLLFVATLASTAVLAAPFAYVPRPYNDDLAIIDVATNQVVKFLPVGDFPQGVAISPTGDFIYIMNFSGHSISVVSGATHTVVATIELEGMPSSGAVSPDGKKLYVTQWHKTYPLLVIDTVTRKVVASYAGETTGSGVAVSPDGAFVYYASETHRRLSKIDTQTLKLVAKAVTGELPEGVTVTPDGNQVYVATWEGKGATLFDNVTNTAQQITTGQFPWSPAASPDGSAVWVANALDNTISIISTATHKVVQTIPTGKKPMSVAFTPDGKFAYVVNEDDHSVQAIKVASLLTVATVPIGANGFAFGRFIIQGKPHGPIYIETVSPLKRAPDLNAMTAGSAVDLRFSLGGDQGLGVLAAGSPTSEQIVCPTAIPMGTPDLPRSTATPGRLRYDAQTGVYAYAWATDPSWSRTCRRLALELTDGTRQELLMQFR